MTFLARLQHSAAITSEEKVINYYFFCLVRGKSMRRSNVTSDFCDSTITVVLSLVAFFMLLLNYYFLEKMLKMYKLIWPF